MTQTPIPSTRIRSTRVFVATPIDGGKRQNRDAHNTPKPKITTISSAEEYLDFIAEDDRLCMVKFYASWCKSCQKMGMQYERIGKEIGDLVITNKDGTETVVKSGEIRLAQIEYGANRKLCKSLDVKKVPSVHFYSQRKKVDGFPCGPKKIAMLLEKLSHYRSLSLVELSFEADMNEGSALADRVLETLCEDEESTSPQCITDQDS